MTAPHASSSAVQQKAEAVIREALAEALGVPLSPRKLQLVGGTQVDVDAATEDTSLLAEIFARQGQLKGGQQKKVAIDALKLITLRRAHPDARLLLAFADEAAAQYATGKGWVAEALRQWEIDVIVVEIPSELRQEILTAQGTQKMVNADAAVGDVV